MFRFLLYWFFLNFFLFFLFLRFINSFLIFWDSCHHHIFLKLSCSKISLYFFFMSSSHFLLSLLLSQDLYDFFIRQFLIFISGDKFIVIIFSYLYLLKLHFGLELRYIFEPRNADRFGFIHLFFQQIFVKLLFQSLLSFFFCLIIVFIFFLKFFIKFGYHFFFMYLPFFLTWFSSALNIFFRGLFFSPLRLFALIMSCFPVEIHGTSSLLTVVKQNPFLSHSNYYNS